MPDRQLERKSEKAIVHGIGIVQITNTTKYHPKITGILPSCILPPPEVTSHTLFKDGDVMNILEEFWYGNLDPAEYDSCTTKEYKEILQLISRNEEKLLATMSEEQKDLFSRYTDCVREHQAMAECLLFQNSFRLGARMMLVVMEEHTNG